MHSSRDSMLHSFSIKFIFQLHYVLTSSSNLCPKCNNFISSNVIKVISKIKQLTLLTLKMAEIIVSYVFA